MKNINNQNIESNQYIQTLIDNFPFMVWLKDTQSRILVANSAYANMVGVASSHELIGKTDFDFFPPELAQEYVDGDKRAMLSTSPSAVTVPTTVPGGESPASVRSRTLRDRPPAGQKGLSFTSVTFTAIRDVVVRGVKTPDATPSVTVTVSS